MIIVCPRCSTKYKITKEAITKAGKKVKCTKCRHSWFQEGNVSTPSIVQEAKCSTSAATWLKLIALGFLVLVIMVGTVVFQSCITTKFQFAEVIYDKIGMPSTSQLELNNVAVYEKGNGILDVNGFIVNHAKVSRRVPTILVNFMDDKGRLIVRSARPPLRYLKPNEKYPFFKMIHDATKSTRIISVEIADKLEWRW